MKKKIILAILLAVISFSVVNAQRTFVPTDDDWGRTYISKPVEIFLQNTGGSGGHAVLINFFQYGNRAGVGEDGCYLTLQDWGGVFVGCTFNGIKVKLSNGKTYTIATRNPECFGELKDGTKVVRYKFSPVSLDLFKKYRVIAAGVVASSEYNRNPKLDVEWWNKLDQGRSIKIQRQARYMDWSTWDKLWK